MFSSDRSAFNRKNSSFIEMVIAHMAMDIEVYIKQSAGTPVDTGGMKSEVRHFKTLSGRYRVEADKAYSAVQEKGEANGHVFQHYTTAGTSAGWFKRSISAITRNRASYIDEARKAVGL